MINIDKKYPNLNHGTGKDNFHWKGGIKTRKDGYVMVRMGVFKKNSTNAYKLQHRLVMEKVVGRELLRSEIVHHKNGNNGDNRIENLEIMTQAEHARLHGNTRAKNNKGQFI